MPVWMRFDARNVVPVVLLATGAWLHTLGVTVPGSPVVIPGLYPTAVASDRSGDLYIADGNPAMFEGDPTGNACVWKVSPWGARSRVAGVGEARPGADGVPATRSALVDPKGLAIDADSNFYISDAGSDRVRKVDRAGIITTFAGSGRAGNGGPAERAQLDNPLDLCFDALGNLLIAEWGSHSIRSVGPDGVIDTVAGVGKSGFGGDGGPARRATLWDPQDIAVDADGMLYLVDEVNHRVRRVDRSGVITTVVGSGEIGHNAGGWGGDGGSGPQARLKGPLGVACSPDGTLFIADTGNHRIRRLSRDGIVSSVAGSTIPGTAGDGAPARKSSFLYPMDLAFDSQGTLNVADLLAGSVRRIGTNGLISTVASDVGRFAR